MQNRRTFLGQIGSGAMLAGLPVSLESLREFVPAVPSHDASSWDVSWTKRVTGKYRAVFDVAAIDSGHGTWRANVWQKQYADILKARPRDMSTVLVLRAKGIALAMQQRFWDEYEIGKAYDVKHPVTEEPTDRNPVLLSSTRKEVPAMFDDLALDAFIAHGGIALACNLAFNDMIGLVSKKHGLADDAAREIAVAALVPGVTLQPSGVFAALRAQDVGCNYIRAS